MGRPPRTRDSAATWYRLADAETRVLLAALPEALRARVAEVPVRYLDRPDRALLAEGWPEDLLGLFSGAAYGEALTSPDPSPPEIQLFIENLRDEAGDDPQAFRQEVRTTLLHEIGHYLGLEESELEARELE